MQTTTPQTLFLFLLLPFLTHSLTLSIIDPTTGNPLKTLSNNFQICSSDYPTGFTLEAIPSLPIDNMYFWIPTMGNYKRTEFFTPYVVAGDRDGVIRKWSKGMGYKGNVRVIVEGRKGGKVVERIDFEGVLGCEGGGRVNVVVSPDVVMRDLEDDGLF